MAGTGSQDLARGPEWNLIFHAGLGALACWLGAAFVRGGLSRRRVFVPLTLLVGAVSPILAADVPAGEGQTAPIRVAFSGSMFVDVNENDAGAAVRGWAQMLGKDRGIPVDPAAKILRGAGAIAQAIRSNLVDVITLTAEEYWTIRQYVSFDSFVLGVKDGRVTEEYVLLVHRDSRIQGLGDLKGRKLICFENPRASLASIWLETQLAKEGLDRTSEFCGQVTKASKLTKAVLPVFFHQADACVVTRSGFDTTSELNPQVGQQLKVLASSAPVVPVVFCFRGNYVSPFRDKLLAEIPNMGSTPAGQQFLTLFQCGALERHPLSSVDSACDLLDLHRQLCGSTNHVLVASPNLQSGEARAKDE